VYRFAFLLVVCTIVAPGSQSPAGSPDSEREKDVYAIYSLMMTNPRTSHGPDNNERYLIAATTATHQPTAPCVVPPKELEADFREALADYERRKGKPRELKPTFSIRKPYLLLSADEVRAFQSKVPDRRSRGVTDVFTLSDVYFNRRQTLALTAISTWCGDLCGLHQWKVFEKLNTGKWEERTWGGCVTIAGRFRRFSTEALKAGLVI
jgi:hypothetical protein